MKVKILAIKRGKSIFVLLLQEEVRAVPTIWTVIDKATDTIGAIKMFIGEWESRAYETYKASASRIARVSDGFTPEQLALTEGLELDLGGE